MENNKDTKYTYPSPIYECIRRIMECSIIPEYRLLYDNADIISILYNQFNNYPITRQVYSLIWRWLNKLSSAGCTQGIKSYWSQANQHYGFKLQYSSDDDAKSKFREFHVMVGTMLVYTNQYETLKYILNFSNTLPQKYYLVPSTFISIFDVYKDLRDKNDKELYLMHYHMAGLYEGAGEENKIEGLLIDYLSLLIIRLNTVSNYNITYSDPFSIPQAEGTIGKDRALIYSVYFFQKRILNWKNKKKELISLGYSEQDVKKAIMLLNNYKSELDTDIKKIKENPTISLEKEEILRDSMLSAMKTIKIGVPEIKECKSNNSSEQKPFIAQQYIPLDSELILNGYEQMPTGFGEAVINSIFIQIRQYYCYQFLINSPSATYTIPYSDMSKALKKLAVTDEYTILSLGISNNFFDETEGFKRDDDGNVEYNGAKVIQIASNSTSLLIMKTTSVPKGYITDLPEDEIEKEGLKLMDEDIKLYSNLNSMTKDNLILRVKIGYNVQVPTNFKYVRIAVAYRLSTDDILVDRVEPVSKFL